MTSTLPRRGTQPRTPQGKVAKWFDERLMVAGPLRKQLNKVFPDHWTFMMGEIALYSFIILLLTGTYLTFFFDPSMADTVYNGRYIPMHGVTMSRGAIPALVIASRQSISWSGNSLRRRGSSDAGATICNGSMPSTAMKVCIVL